MSANAKHCNCIYTYDMEKALTLMDSIANSCNVPRKFRISHDSAELIFENGLSFIWLNPKLESRGVRFHFVYMDRNITLEERERVLVLSDLYWNENFEWI